MYPCRDFCFYHPRRTQFILSLERLCTDVLLSWTVTFACDCEYCCIHCSSIILVNGEWGLFLGIMNLILTWWKSHYKSNCINAISGTVSCCHIEAKARHSSVSATFFSHWNVYNSTSGHSFSSIAFSFHIFFFTREPHLTLYFSVASLVGPIVTCPCSFNSLIFVAPVSGHTYILGKESI